MNTEKPVGFLVVVLALLLIAVGCSGSTGDEGTDEIQKVSGVITDVEARSLLELESIELLDEHGIRWRLQASRRGLTGGIHGFTPSHLREHMVQGAPIVVMYIEDDGVLTIVSIGE